MTSAANDVSADVVSMCGPSDTRSSDLHFFPDEPESRRDIPPQTADRSNLLLYGTNDWLTVSLHHIASYVRPDSYQKLAIRKSFTDLLTYLEQLLCTVFSSHRMSYAASMKLQSVTSCLPAMRYRRPFSGSATVLILHTSYWHSLPASSVQTDSRASVRSAKSYNISLTVWSNDFCWRMKLFKLPVCDRRPFACVQSAADHLQTRWRRRRRRRRRGERRLRLQWNLRSSGTGRALLVVGGRPARRQPWVSATQCWQKQTDWTR